MHWIHLLGTILLVTTAVTTETVTTPESNEVLPTEAVTEKSTSGHHLRRLVIPIDLDDDTPANSATPNTISTNTDETGSGKDEILEESTVPDKMSVHFYSANVDAETNTEGDLLKYLLEKVGNPINNESKVIIKYTATEKPAAATSSVDNESNSSNDIAAISTKKEAGKATESVTAKDVKAADNVKDETPATTKKPAPTHNEDGENIEVVDKEDIKILQAPLVQAFTVHQDDVGSPKKVVPLIPLLQPTPIPVVQVASHTFSGPSNFVQSELVTAAPLLNVQPHNIQLPVPSFLQPQALQKHYTDMRGSFAPQVPPVTNSIPTSVNPNVHQPARDLLPPFGNNQFAVQSVPQIQQSLQIVPNFANIQQQTALLQNQQQQQLNLQQQLLERQKYLENQIAALQNQAYQQQQQIILQQKLLQDSRRKRFESQSAVVNQLIPNGNGFGKVHQQKDVTAKHNLEIVASVTQSPRYEISTQQHLPVRDAVNFSLNQAGPQQQAPRTSNVDIQASTQLAFNSQQQQQQQQQQAPQTNIQSPLELSNGLQLPQRSFQQFRQNVPNNGFFTTQSLALPTPQFLQQHILQQQLLQQQQHQQQQQLLLQQQQQQQHQLLQQQILQQQQQLPQQLTKNRNFRSELPTGNLGLNQPHVSSPINFFAGQPKYVTHHQQQAFVPQTTPAVDIQLQSLLYQSALNHGINPHVPQNLQIPHWPFGSF